MTERRKLAAPDVVISGVVGLVFLAGFVAYMLQLHPVAVYMDTLRFLGYYDDSISGRHSIWTTWNQGQHRGILPQAVVYLNARFFHLSIFGCTMLSGAFIGLTGFALCLEMARSGLSRLTLMALAILTYAALFSPSNWEIYSVDVGAALFAKNLCFILYWILLDRALRASARSAFALCILTAPLIVLLVAFGWSYAFVVTSIFAGAVAAWKTPFWRRAVTIGAALLGSMALYIILGHVFPAARLAPDTPATAANLWNMISGAVFAVSSIFLGQESIEVYGVPFGVLALAGIVTVGTAAYALLGNLTARRRESIVPNALIAYALLDAASVAIARGMIDPHQTMASRYFEDLSLLIVGIAWSVALLPREIPARRAVSVLTIALSMLFLVGQSATAANEWVKVPYRHEAFEKMAGVTLAGPTTVADARLLQQPIESAQRASAIQRKYGLGPFRRIACEVGPVINGSGWYPNDEGSSWMDQSASVTIRNCGDTVHVRAYVPEIFPMRTVTLSVNGKPLKSFDVLPGHMEDLVAPISTDDSYLTVRISVDHVTVPSQAFPGSHDSRALGLLVSSVRSTP